MYDNHLSDLIIKVARQIHSELGPGLPVAVYEVILQSELRDYGLVVERQLPVPVFLGRTGIRGTLNADVVIENTIVLVLHSHGPVRQSSKTKLRLMIESLKCNEGFLLDFSTPDHTKIVARISPQ